MMASQEIMIRRTEPQQKQLMRLLPVPFGIFLFRIPAGLLVYSVTTTTLTFFQNLIIYRAVPKQAAGGQGSEDALTVRKLKGEPEAGSKESASASAQTTKLSPTSPSAKGTERRRPERRVRGQSGRRRRFRQGLERRTSWSSKAGGAWVDRHLPLRSDPATAT
jgi:hypothetical protein